MHKYHLDFILHIHNASPDNVKSSIAEFSEHVEICEAPLDSQDTLKGTSYRLSVQTQDPTIIFDICSQFGKLMSVKINEEHT